MKRKTTTEGLARFFSLLALMGLVAALAPAVHTAAGAVDTAPAAPSACGGLLQFTAGGHVLGFAPEAAYLATGSHALRVGFVGAKAMQPQGEAGRGDSPAGAQPLGRVTYAGLWEGVTLTYEAVAGGVAKSTYHLAPGADAEQVRLAYNVPVQVQADGSLRLVFETGEMSESTPLAWQEIEGQRVPVPVDFEVQGRTVGFRLGDHDPRYPLTIDPSYTWHTFYGGGDDDRGWAIAMDSSGGVYVAGESSTTWQGDSGADPLHAHSGDEDITVLKLDSAGAYQWHTFYGGSEWDAGNGITVDNSNGVYVTGYSLVTWQGDGGADPLHPHSGDIDITVLKLDSAGIYQWHTFYGSASSDDGHTIAVDGSGGVYVVGWSYATWQGDGAADPLHPHTEDNDITVLKLDSAGAYQWHTFYGSNYYDTGYGIVLDDSGNVYVAGTSGATWQGDSAADPLHPHEGDLDITVLKLDSNGAYGWHTFYGSSSNDYGWAIAMDGSGGMYVTGYSSVTWQGDGGTDPLHPHSGENDIIVLKLDGAGTYQWHTFYGSNDTDVGHSIAVDSSGDLYVAGHSSATWQGDGDASPLHPHSGNADITVLKLDGTGVYGWHTFYGSSDTDVGYGIVMDDNGDAYVAGSSGDAWQGDTNAGPLHPYSRAVDITVLKLARGYGVYLPLVVKNQ